MSLLKDIENIRGSTFGVVFLAIIVLITPGAGFIFHFSRDLFINLDFLKLILLSLSFSAPFLLSNLLCAAFLEEALDIKAKTEEDKKQALFIGLATSVLLSGAITYLGLLITYLMKFNVHTSIITLIILELVFFIISLITKNQQKS